MNACQCIIAFDVKKILLAPILTSPDMEQNVISENLAGQRFIS